MNEADGFKALELVAFFLVGGGWILWQLWETRETRKPDAPASSSAQDTGEPKA